MRGTTHHQHHAPAPHFLHGVRVLLGAALLVAVFLARIDPAALHAARPDGSVLAFATAVNHSDLLSATNNYRAQSGLGALSLHSQLNSSSQMKAQHMVDNDYWAHVAPDGTQPWHFFTLAGYNYTAAGENLAYGFDSSSAVVNAWYNSPSHRANMLGDYVDVGFGYVNGPSYQGGQYTVVVAHYGKTAAAPTPPAPAAPASPPPTQPATTPPPTETPAPATTPAADEQPAPTTPADTPVNPDDTESTAEELEPLAAPTTSEPQQDTLTAAVTKSVSVIEQLGSANASSMAIFSLGMTVTAAAGLAATHRSLFRQAIASGERFMIAHPALDTVAVATAAALILTATAGHIG